jgi:putative restriction endonuclease
MAVNRWSEDETKSALYLYFQLAFGQIHSGNPEIIALAQALGRSPSSIAMKLANFASLDPKITETGRKGLAGASALDRRVWTDFNENWTRLVADAESLASSNLSGTTVLKEEAVAFVHQPYDGPTTIAAIIEQRVGQNFFRRAVLANYDNRCCVTGIADARLLNASHIIPWSADEHNRHNPRNGLCLSATFDRAFDRGLMSVDQDGRARFSETLLQSESAETRTIFGFYEGNPLLEATRFDPDPAFLKWHHENRYGSPR